MQIARKNSVALAGSQAELRGRRDWLSSVCFCPHSIFATKNNVERRVPETKPSITMRDLTRNVPCLERSMRSVASIRSNRRVRLGEGKTARMPYQGNGYVCLLA